MRIALAIFDLEWMNMIWSGWTIKEKYHVLLNQLEIFIQKTLVVGKLSLFSGM